MNPLILEDIFIQMCYQIKNLTTIISIEVVSKWHMRMIRKNKWIDLSDRIKNDKNLIHMLKTHNFSNLNLHASNVTDYSVSKLVNVYTLDLSWTKVTDMSISKLINVHTLDLSGTEVTDDVVSKLVNVHTLNLHHTKVSDDTVSKLVNAHTLSLKYEH